MKLPRFREHRLIEVSDAEEATTRYVIALEAHHTEREADLLGLFLGTLRRVGAPDGLYLDNGSTWRCGSAASGWASR